MLPLQVSKETERGNFMLKKTGTLEPVDLTNSDSQSLTSDNHCLLFDKSHEGAICEFHVHTFENSDY